MGGGMGFEATVVMKKLAASLAMKCNEPYSHVVSWIRCSLAFSLAHSAIPDLFIAGLLSLCWLTSSLPRPASAQHAKAFHKTKKKK